MTRIKALVYIAILRNHTIFQFQPLYYFSFIKGERERERGWGREGGRGGREGGRERRERGREREAKPYPISTYLINLLGLLPRQPKPR